MKAIENLLGSDDIDEKFLKEDIDDVFKQTCFMTKKLNEEENENDAYTTTEQLFESGLNGFSISMDKVFFWNGFKVWYIDTNTIQDGYAFKEVGLLVSPNET